MYGELAAWGRVVLSAFAPRRCAGCGIAGEWVICPACAAELDRLEQPAARLDRHGGVTAAYTFDDPVRHIVHRAKYGGERPAVETLARLATPRLRAGVLIDPDIVVPVPLGRRRRRQRGFNQAAVMAVVLAEAASLPLSTQLVRTRDTAPQVGHDEQQRWRNVEGCFAWQGPSLAGATVWLMDDVLTTGATAQAAADALHLGGAARVETAVLAAVP
ncbi:MAG: ComF family protein [Candidatus Dormibacteria bacterium]